MWLLNRERQNRERQNRKLETQETRLQVKLRYYLRGLGIGVIVTALLMGFVTRESLPLTDAEIKARARALGMVESDSLKLSDIQQIDPSKQNPPGNGSTGSEPSESQNPPESTEPSDDGSTDLKSPESSEPPEPSEPLNPPDDGSAGPEPSESQNPPESSEPPETQNPPESSQPAEQDSSEEPQTVTFTVKSGYSSDKVSKLLKEAGLVENAGEFDRFLVNGGYANRISVGTYEIEVGASMERIAKIITRSK